MGRGQNSIRVEARVVMVSMWDVRENNGAQRLSKKALCFLFLLSFEWIADDFYYTFRILWHVCPSFCFPFCFLGPFRVFSLFSGYVGG